MDQARSTISKIFNGEPHSYTRFNLTQNMEGDNSHVEMKLSSDIDEEAGGNGVGGHLNHAASSKPYISQKLGRTPKNLCFTAAAVFLIFIIGRREKLVFSETVTKRFSSSSNWSLKTPPSPRKICFLTRSCNDHRAGSPGDEELGNKVMDYFNLFGMTTWTDEHFIKVHDPPASGFNRILFKDGTEERPKGFLSYSATGSVTGGALYAHYGQESEFRLLLDKNINISGRVLLIRTGKISFAEKVANAAKMNASAVLIYPDSADTSIDENTELYGHVHLGTGDPYTPGFPSFNHTQFPPVQSSGLPSILAQTITRAMATKILGKLGGQNLPQGWGASKKLGDEGDSIIVQVNNVLAEKKIHNVFGVIKGFVDSDRYVVIGAQRDAWGPGFAASTVGTSVLVELARSISDMVKNDGFKPRRSIVFASWSAGEYGSVGATEWQEGYLSSLSMKAFSYINLDGIVAGKGYMEPMKLDDAAYPFLVFSGIPSVSFRFTYSNSDYHYFRTIQDTRQKLNAATSNQVAEVAVTAGRFAGHIALRQVHDHLLQMDLMRYNKIIRTQVAKINGKVKEIKRVALTVQWLISASGSYSRAARSLESDIQNSDLEDIQMCRLINDRIMTVEKNFLSPYISPRESPFRHILLGSGPHTLKALADHLDALKTDDPEADADLFRSQFAMTTWTIQGCANSLAGNIWSLDNEI
uniref:Transferrin receptor protein 1 n=1 Tax=Oryzias sinensis TaxID=183150 RepID=A0A8C7YST1_9TELE